MFLLIPAHPGCPRQNPESCNGCERARMRACCVCVFITDLTNHSKVCDIMIFCITHTHNRFTALWILSRTTQVSRYQKKHSPTRTYRGHQISPSASSIYYDTWHPPYSIHMLYSHFHNISPSFLWSTSWPGTLHCII